MEQAQWEFERKYLEDTISLAREQLQKIQGKSGLQEDEMLAAQEEFQENAARAVEHFQFSQEFEDLVELSEHAMALTEQADLRQKQEREIRSLTRALDRPYFARIDFLMDGQSKARLVYIGRATLMGKKITEIQVYDWRAPIASVFYQYGVGKAKYRAPNTTITGEVLLKRQHEIKRGKLEYFFDSDVQVVDSFLREILSGPTPSTMKTIVETIQRDQDMIIRDMDSDVLMVQGTAGSGKTSIALHRMAYLMYQGEEKRLHANQMVILSPNPIFESYIANVLPDLGEQSVRMLLVEDLLEAVLPGVPIQTKQQYWEAVYTCENPKESATMRRCAAFKGSILFVQILERFVSEIPSKWIDFRDVDYGGRCIATRQQSKAAICNDKRKAPLGIRLQWLEHAICEKVRAARKPRLAKLESYVLQHTEHVTEADAYARMLSIAQSGGLVKEIRAFTRVDCFALYQALFETEGLLERLAGNAALPEEMEAIRSYTCRRLHSQQLSYDDGMALAFLMVRVQGCNTFCDIRQMVVDEAQDAEPLHYALLRELFPRARFTVLGDVNQTIAKQVDGDFYERVGRILGKPTTVLKRMERCFRSTEEIWRFSSRILPNAQMGECFSRKGEEPEIHCLPDGCSEEKAIVQAAKDAQAKGHRSIALLVKSQEEAEMWHERLKGAMNIERITNDNPSKLEGVMMMPLYMAKGLEFDAVLVCDADAEHYGQPEDQNLLYIACSRALHRLHLFYTGEISPWLLKSQQEGEK